MKNKFLLVATFSMCMSFAAFAENTSPSALDNQIHIQAKIYVHYSSLNNNPSVDVFASTIGLIASDVIIQNGKILTVADLRAMLTGPSEIPSGEDSLKIKALLSNSCVLSVPNVVAKASTENYQDITLDFDTNASVLNMYSSLECSDFPKNQKCQGESVIRVELSENTTGVGLMYCYSSFENKSLAQMPATQSMQAIVSSTLGSAAVISIPATSERK